MLKTCTRHSVLVVFALTYFAFQYFKNFISNNMLMDQELEVLGPLNQPKNLIRMGGMLVDIFEITKYLAFIDRTKTISNRDINYFIQE